MSIRDNVLPKVDKARAKIASVGLRRYTVTLRRRSWSGGAPGLGVATDTDVLLTPTPRVRLLTTKEVADSGGTYREGDFRVDKITPRYSGTSSGGYTPAALDLRPAGPNEDVTVILVGDDDVSRESSLVKLETDKPFEYAMVVRLIRPGVRG